MIKTELKLNNGIIVSTENVNLVKSNESVLTSIALAIASSIGTVTASIFITIAALTGAVFILAVFITAGIKIYNTTDKAKVKKEYDALTDEQKQEVKELTGIVTDIANKMYTSIGSINATFSKVGKKLVPDESDFNFLDYEASLEFDQKNTKDHLKFLTSIVETVKKLFVANNTKRLSIDNTYGSIGALILKIKENKIDDDSLNYDFICEIMLAKISDILKKIYKDSKDTVVIKNKRNIKVESKVKDKFVLRYNIELNIEEDTTFQNDKPVKNGASILIDLNGLTIENL